MPDVVQAAKAGEGAALLAPLIEVYTVAQGKLEEASSGAALAMQATLDSKSKQVNRRLMALHRKQQIKPPPSPPPQLQPDTIEALAQELAAPVGP